MPDLADYHLWPDHQIQRAPEGCELEGLKRKLVWFGSEERQIERWLDSQTRLHMYVHRN